MDKTILFLQTPASCRLPIQLARPLLRSRNPIIPVPKVFPNHRQVLRVRGAKLEALKVIELLVAGLEVAVARVVGRHEILNFAPVPARPRLAVARAEAAVVGVEGHVPGSVVGGADRVRAEAV